MTPPTSTLIFCSRFELHDLDQSAGQALDPVFLVNDLCLDLAPQKKTPIDLRVMGPMERFGCAEPEERDADWERGKVDSPLRD